MRSTRKVVGARPPAGSVAFQQVQLRAWQGFTVLVAIFAIGFTGTSIYGIVRMIGGHPLYLGATTSMGLDTLESLVVGAVLAGLFLWAILFSSMRISRDPVYRHVLAGQPTPAGAEHQRPRFSPHRLLAGNHGSPPPTPEQVAAAIGLPAPTGSAVAAPLLTAPDPAAPAGPSLTAKERRSQAKVARAALNYQNWRRDPQGWQRQRRTRAWVVVGIFFLVMLVMAAALTTTAINRHSEWRRSLYVQSHGVLDIGTATSVQESTAAFSGGRYGGSTKVATIDVRLKNSVNGSDTAQVHYPAKADGLSVGMTIDLLVDPRDPHYAEVQGTAGYNVYNWISYVGYAVLVDAVACLFLFSLLGSLFVGSATATPPADAAANEHSGTPTVV